MGDDLESGLPDVKLADWELADLAKDRRLSLLAAGYVPLPVTGKIPALAGWQDGIPDADEINQWTKGCPGALNTGITTALTPTLDIDILNEEAAVAVEEMARERFEERGYILTRIGKPPKRVVLFRTDKPFNKIAVNLIAPNGDTHKIEFLCDGQQVVVHGTHPDTKRAYTWLGGEPGQLAHQALPHITSLEARRLIDDAADLLISRFGYKPVNKSNGTHATHADSGRNCGKPNAGIRERQYAKAALNGCANELANTPEGGRNDVLNKKAFRIGSMVAAGWIAHETAFDRLLNAALASGLAEFEARRTLESGLGAGEKKPHEALNESREKARLSEAAGDPTDDALIAELAALSPLEYAKQRLMEARRLGITVAMLDRAVQEHKGEQPAAPPARWHVELWERRVEGAELLDELLKTFERYLILPKHGATAIALWVLHAWAIVAAYVSPFLMFTSPEMRCGKSTALALLSRTAPLTVMASNISPAAVFRFIEAFQPTLLIDEADSFAVDNEQLRGILNSGHTRDTASIIRLTGDDHEPKEFSTWAPKAIASIGKLAATLQDRSIIIPMQRKRASERVAKLRARQDDREFLNLRRKAKRWATDNIETLKAVNPEIPSYLNDRAADNWEPLLAIADLAGKPWPDLAREAAKELSGSNEADSQTIRVQLLAAIKSMFANPNTDRILSKTMVADLISDENAPWAAYGKSGKPITPRQVAHLLSDFGIRPQNVRDQTVLKGYLRESFADAFTRYLPDPPLSSATPLQASNLNDSGKNPSATAAPAVADRNQHNPLKPNDCSLVADRDPPAGQPGEKCAQCNGAIDGKERPHTINQRQVWLHPECKPFWREGGGWGVRR